MPNCAFVHCKNYSRKNKDLRFYSLPTVITHSCNLTTNLSQRRRREWLTIIGRKDGPETKKSGYRVCSEHFVNGIPANLMTTDDIDWVPSVNVAPPDKRQDAKLRRSVGRYARRGKKLQAHSSKPQQDSACEPMDLDETVIRLCESDDSGIATQTEETSCVDATSQCDVEILTKQVVNIECQTDRTGEEIERLDTDCYNLRTKLEQTKSEFLNVSDISQESLSKNDKKVAFYTGLPTFALLMVLYNNIQACIDNTHHNAMTKFNEILLTLIKLRLNVPLRDLAFRFSISESTAGCVFKKWIHVMNNRISPLIQWPDREHLQSTMPGSFRKSYGDKIIAVIIGCFEVFVIRPSNMLARAITCSYYKHHNTVKFLIGIAPQGNIIYISKGWGGRVSDKHLTENCGFLDNIIPGDVVMADRGSLSVYNSSQLIPAFTRGKDQLTMIETENSRSMSNLRIHAEHVIGVMRSKYTILKGTLPVEFLLSELHENPLIDEIAAVCCGLVNMCPTIVSQE